MVPRVFDCERAHHVTLSARAALRRGVQRELDTTALVFEGVGLTTSEGESFKDTTDVAYGTELARSAQPVHGAESIPADIAFVQRHLGGYDSEMRARRARAFRGSGLLQSCELSRRRKHNLAGPGCMGAAPKRARKTGFAKLGKPRLALHGSKAAPAPRCW